MKRVSTLLFFLFVTFLMFAQPVRITCIGNSITYGAFIQNREKNCYPAQLQAYLGSGYEVRNFGVNGCTAITRGDYPYINTEEYQKSLAFQPDIVLMKLGTNDSKPQNWKYKEDFEFDLQAIINSYRNLNSNPRIILLTPIRCFLPENSVGISNIIIESKIRPIVRDVARQNKLEIIDLSNLFGDKWEPDLLPDRLHPSSKGAGVMAENLFNYLNLASHKSGK